MPKGNDSSLLEKLFTTHGTQKTFVKPKLNKKAVFGIQHYAGTVYYSSAGKLLCSLVDTNYLLEILELLSFSLSVSFVIITYRVFPPIFAVKSKGLLLGTVLRIMFSCMVYRFLSDAIHPPYSWNQNSCDKDLLHDFSAYRSFLHPNHAHLILSILLSPCICIFIWS